MFIKPRGKGIRVHVVKNKPGGLSLLIRYPNGHGAEMFTGKTVRGKSCRVASGVNNQSSTFFEGIKSMNVYIKDYNVLERDIHELIRTFSAEIFSFFWP